MTDVSMIVSSKFSPGLGAVANDIVCERMLVTSASDLSHLFIEAFSAELTREVRNGTRLVFGHESV